GAARGVDQSRSRSHQRKLRCSDKPSGAAAQDEMDRDDVGLTEELILRNECRARAFSFLRSQVLTPRNDFHPECEADSRHRRADIAKPEHSQGLAAELFADRCLPSPVANSLILPNDRTDACEN